MKQLYIIVEGETEEAFVKELLAPYLYESYGLHTVIPIKIKATRGGFVNYQHLKNDVENLLKNMREFIVTTFVDFFKIPTSMPNYTDCMALGTADNKIHCLEEAMEKDIDNNRFVAYIQKHEFEALLFSDNKGFEIYYDKCISGKTKLIVEAYNNPENINSHPQNAPSKRLETIFKECGEKYNKPFDGNMIALELSMEIILEKCPNFRKWIEKLAARGSNI